jgi:hypothetical protein
MEHCRNGVMEGWSIGVVDRWIDGWMEWSQALRGHAPRIQ